MKNTFKTPTSKSSDKKIKCAFCDKTFLDITSEKMHEESYHKKALAKALAAIRQK